MADAISPLALLAVRADILNLQGCRPRWRLLGNKTASTTCSLPSGELVMSPQGAGAHALKLQQNLSSKGQNHDFQIWCMLIYVM
jgi:hypothetical protein